MVAALVLVAGVTCVLVVGAAVVVAMGNSQILPSLIPLAPWLVFWGCVLLILTEMLLFFGSKEDRRAAVRDLAYLFPTLLISAGLGFVAQHFLWK